MVEREGGEREMIIKKKKRKTEGEAIFFFNFCL
jgi:hypothetical protein